MRILVACEHTGAVRDAFRRIGHDAVSCDLLPTETEGPHIEGDVLPHLADGWDMMIAHPPCTHLCSSGARWFSAKRAEQEQAVAFVRALLDAPIPRICIENPIGVLSSKLRKPDQIIQPWEFGHGETKATCLWLKRLPPLFSTGMVTGREQRMHRLPPSADRWKLRSATYRGIAEAMAAQWGSFPALTPDRKDQV